MLTENTRPKRPRITLWLELEPRCNINCSFCYNYWKDGKTKRQRAISSDALRACLADLLDEVDCDSVALSGGEPLLHPDLVDFVSLCSERGVRTVLTTNGTLLNPERLAHLRRVGLTSIQVPLHSARPDIHDLLSGAACWHASVEALARARSLGMDSTPVFVATRKNYEHFVGVLELIFMLGITRIIFNRFVPSGAGIRHRAELDIDDDTLIHTLQEVNGDAKKLGITIEMGVRTAFDNKLDGLSSVLAGSCRKDGTKKYTLDFAGELKHCSQSPTSLGNLQEFSFRDLENRVSQVTSELRQAMVESCYCAALSDR